MTATDRLLPWLLEQMSADERVAWAALPALGDPPVYPDYRTYDGKDIEAADAFLVQFAPARVLRQVAAMRRIVAHCAARLRDGEESADAETDGMVSLVLRLMAAVYADRAGYRSEWAPDA